MRYSSLQLVRQGRRAALLGLCLAALTGCQSLSSTGSSARVRIIDVSSDVPPLDIYQGSNGVAYNLSFGTVTSYLPLTPGQSTLTVNTAGSRQVLATIDGVFAADAHYTVLVGGSITSSQQAILLDRGPAAPSAKGGANPSVRFIHQATHSGAVDVYFVPAGRRLSSVSPLISNLTAGTSTGYLAAPVCTCTVLMLPAGTPPSTAATAVHSGAQASYVSGSARTMILLDAQPAASSSVQVITATDAEPVN
jgi:hypothetical protein